MKKAQYLSVVSCICRQKKRAYFHILWVLVYFSPSDDVLHGASLWDSQKSGFRLLWQAKLSQTRLSLQKCQCCCRQAVSTSVTSQSSAHLVSRTLSLKLANNPKPTVVEAKEKGQTELPVSVLKIIAYIPKQIKMVRGTVFPA